MPARSRRVLVALAVAVPLLLLLLVDVGLRAAGWLPPDDPLLFFTRTRQPDLDPFVPAGDGTLAIRPDWVNDGLGLRGRRGGRAGRQFLLPGFRPARLATDKPEGALRVFALGGSTTYGLFVGAERAFPALLAERLRERAGGRPVEVVNLGCPGFASDRVAALLPRLLALEPDLLVVLAGHNEMLGGPHGPAADLSPALALRARLLRASSLFAWWNHWLAGTLRRSESRWVREEVAALEAGQIPTYVPEAVPASARAAPDPSFRRRAAVRFARHLGELLAEARQAGVPVLVAIPAANLRSPPALSAHPEDFEHGARFEEELRAGRALLAAGKPEPALARISTAVWLSPGHAGAHFARAEAFLALGRRKEARSVFRRAVDLDVRTHRITSEIGEAARETLRAHDLRFVDLRPLFQTELDAESAAALFVDHVHPTALGHARIAEALLPLAAERLGLPAPPGDRVSAGAGRSSP